MPTRDKDNEAPPYRIEAGQDGGYQQTYDYTPPRARRYTPEITRPSSMLRDFMQAVAQYTASNMNGYGTGSGRTMMTDPLLARDPRVLNGDFGAQYGPTTFSVNGNPNSPVPSPGLGSGVPQTQMYEDFSSSYPGSGSDPLLALMQALLNRRHPNGM